MKTQVAMIGFGEAGRILGKGLVDTGGFEVAAWDILMRDPTGREEMSDAAGRCGVRMARDVADVLVGARCRGCPGWRADRDFGRDRGLRGGRGAGSGAAAWRRANFHGHQFGFSRGQAAKRDRGGAIRCLDAAVMESVPPTGIRVPMLLGGDQAQALKTLLEPAGMNLEVISDRVGVASAVKMCRSVMIKGLEALTIECFLAARRYGVEERVIASLDKTFPHMEWERQGDYLMSRVVRHGRRRAAEMREAVTTLREAGLDPFMTEGTVARQQWVADLARSGVFSAASGTAFRWRDGADAIRAAEVVANDTHERA